MIDALRQIDKERSDFENKDISIVPGFTFNQCATIDLCTFYYNSKFKSGQTDRDGDRKYFYNINKNPCKVFTKAVDFDTKNIRLLTSESGNSLKTWFMERDLKYWMRDKQFGKVLNRIFHELPIYGSCVLKIIEGEPYFVDLRNFIVEQSADSLYCSNYIIEMHNYTPNEFRKIAKQMKWPKTKVDEVLTKFYQMKGTSHIKLYERYGDLQDEKGEYTYRRVFYADVGIDEFDQSSQRQVSSRGVELSSEEWDPEAIETLYWEFHAEKIPGRWLGIGVVEALFEPQVRANELANLQAKASYWAALRIFQTRDSAISRNMMTDVRNGEVLNCDSEITQIDMSDRNLAFFNEEHQKWLNNRDELSFSYDVVQGQRPPADQPLGAVQIAAAQTLSYFETIQENIALDVKEMLYKIIIPQFEKENTTEHILRIVGQDLDTFAEMIKNDLILKELIRQATSGKFPTNEDKDIIAVAIEERIKQGKENLITIPKDFYKDIKYDIDIDITGESVDTRVKYATIFAILQAVTADPTMTTDPFKRKLLFNIAEEGGVNLNEFLPVQKQSIENVMPQNMPQRGSGGGVSAPALGNKLAGQTVQTV